MKYGLKGFFAAGLCATAHAASAQQMPDPVADFTPHMEGMMCVLTHNGNDNIMVPLAPASVKLANSTEQIIPNKVAIWGKLQAPGGIIFVSPDPYNEITLSIAGVSGVGHFANPDDYPRFVYTAQRARMKCWDYYKQQLTPGLK